MPIVSSTTGTFSNGSAFSDAGFSAGTSEYRFSTTGIVRAVSRRAGAAAADTDGRVCCACVAGARRCGAERTCETDAGSAARTGGGGANSGKTTDGNATPGNDDTVVVGEGRSRIGARVGATYVKTSAESPTATNQSRTVRYRSAAKLILS
jgi:hypothetical protein